MSQTTIPEENPENFLKVLIDEMSAGCDPSKRNEVAFTKILELNMLSIAKKFLESTLVIDLNKVVVCGSPVLSWAVHNKKSDIIKLLIDKGADINIRDGNWNDTLLLVAIRYDDRVSAKILIDEGANIDLINNNGVTALHRAIIASKHVELAKMLIEAGANLDLPDSDGDTPLLNTIRHMRNDEIAKMLISKGADVTIKNKKGKTVLDYATGDIKKMIEDVLNGNKPVNDGTKPVCVDTDGKEYPCFDLHKPIKMIYRKSDNPTPRIFTIKATECKIKVRKNDKWETEDLNCANMEIQIPNEAYVKLEYHVMLDSAMKEIYVKFPTDLIIYGGIIDIPLGDIYLRPF